MSSIGIHLFVSLQMIYAVLRPTNLECLEFNKSHGVFEYCVLKSINRTYGYGSIKYKVFKPITNARVEFGLYKFSNGYKPFLYNKTFDACAFLRKKTDPLTRYAYSFIEKFSNINHTCPYNHDLMVEQLDYRYANNLLDKMLPFPDGKYAVFTIWSVDNSQKAKVNIYFLKGVPF